MIVATAGHVDHGKTRLVRALTGVETDRLPEEQRRGMSIDLGFAYTDGGRLGFVDVPGHERFVANLLAGIAGIDLALLVVAADDGPMPQTREHLTILALLGVERCIVALTKVDRVDAGRQAVAVGQIRALLATSRFAGAPIFAVAATTGDGLPALRRAIDAVGEELPARGAAGAFRLAIDRSFLLAGAGRIVTGAVLSGRVRVGDRVVVSPQGAALRVRGVHAQGRPAESASAGERCALNLAGAAPKDAPPARGDWIVAPAVHAPTERIDVAFETVRPLRAHAAGLQIHLGGAAVAARVARLSDGFAQIVLDRPVAALHGDRFVLRDPAAGAVVAGGVVLDPFAAARGRAAPERVACLQARTASAAGDALAALVTLCPQGVDLDRFVLARNLDPPAAEALRRRPGIAVVTTDAGNRALATDHWCALRQRVVDALAAWHAGQPESTGAATHELSDRSGTRDLALSRAALAALADAGTVVPEGFRWRLAGHRPVLSPGDAALLARVAAVLGTGGLRPPIVGELASALAVPHAELLDFLARAGRFGTLVRVAPNRWFLPATVAELAGWARRLAAESAAGFDAAAYRDRTGIGRNLTVQVLEFLDREGVTRFDGQRRTTLR